MKWDTLLRERSHKSIDRFAVLEGEHGGDRLHAHLTWDLRMLVDIELHQLHRALGGTHGLLQHQRELPAGAHQGAQKSTSTGTCLDASTTSRTKSLVVVSLMRSPPPAPPPSERIGVSMLIHPGLANPIRLARRRQGGRISWERWAAKGRFATAPRAGSGEGTDQTAHGRRRG